MLWCKQRKPLINYNCITTKILLNIGILHWEIDADNISRVGIRFISVIINTLKNFFNFISQRQILSLLYAILYLQRLFWGQKY